MRKKLVNWPAIWLLLNNSKAGWDVKLLAAFAVVYAIWPLDLLPDLAPVMGWLDDIGVVSAVFAYLAYRGNRYAKELPAAKPET